MSDRPPSPTTPPASPSLPASDAAQADDARIVATTPQLVDAIESSLDCQIDDDVLEEILVELDRVDCVEWLTVTQSGTVVWDLTETPDRLADAIATVVADRVRAWIES